MQKHQCHETTMQQFPVDPSGDETIRARARLGLGLGLSPVIGYHLLVMRLRIEKTGAGTPVFGLVINYIILYARHVCMGALSCNTVKHFK